VMNQLTKERNAWLKRALTILGQYLKEKP